MATSILREIVASDRAVAATTILATAFITAWLLPKLLDYVRLAAIPTVGKDIGGEEQRRLAYLQGARKLYNDGYKRFRNGVFQITTSRKSKVIVLSAKFLPELNKLPSHVLSMQEAVDDAMETKYTRISTSNPIVPHTISGKLTPALPRLSRVVSEETNAALSLEMPPCQDWTEVNIHHKLLRIVAMVSGRVFIGPELNRTEAYLDAAINYTTDIMAAQRVIQEMRPWLRPFLARRQPEVTTLNKRIADADAFMQPLIKQRREANNTRSSSANDKPDDMLEWLIDALPRYPDANSQNLPRVQLTLSFAAIHTTTLTATNAFYSLAAMQEYIPILREEIAQALAENNGVLTSRALQSMKKLDSFLKETMRLNPATTSSFQRKVLRPFTLSSGQHVPASVILEVPAVSINSDPDIFPDPDKFDGLRFYRMREQAKEVTQAAHAQFVSVDTVNLSFGYGRHACPGRFFAASEIKTIVVHVLQRYDMQLVGGATERYPNIEFAHMSIPDPSKTLLFKERKPE